MKTILLGLIIGVFVAPAYKVHVAGELRRIMMRGELSPVIKLDTVADKSHLFGLGPAAGLKGEIIALDGTVYVSRIDKGKINSSKMPNAEAAMFVYTSVEEWDTMSVNSNIKDMSSLEFAIELMARQRGFDLAEPVPFMITTSNVDLSYHVIDWKEGTAHTMENHKQFAMTGTMSSAPLTILGFYASNHHGVITHHTSKIHAHFLETNGQLVGHVDALKFRGGFELRLPKN